MSDDPQHLAFAILVREHHAGLIAYGQSLYATIGRYRDLDAAEDLVQEALLIAFENLVKYDHDRGFAPWVRGIMRFRFLKKARSREMSVDGALLSDLSSVYQEWFGPSLGNRGAGDDPPAWNEDADMPDALAALEHCMHKLQADQLAAVEGFYFTEQPIEALAQSLHATPSAIKKRLQRSRQQLADCIRQRLAMGRGSRASQDKGVLP